MTSFEWKMNPNWKNELLQEAQKKIQSILDLRCLAHDKGPVQTTVDGKLAFETCCDELARRVDEKAKEKPE